MAEDMAYAVRVYHKTFFGEDELFGLHALFFAVSSNHFVHSFGRARCKIVVSDILAFRSTA